MFRNEGAREKFLRLTETEVWAAQANGGLTFAPRRRGLLVCNQLEWLGKISRREAEGLGHQVFPRRAVKKVATPTPLKVVQVVVTVRFLVLFNRFF